MFYYNKYFIVIKQKQNIFILNIFIFDIKMIYLQSFFSKKLRIKLYKPIELCSISNNCIEIM